MNAYQKEQAETLDMVCRHLGTISDKERLALLPQISDYLLFRDEVDAFLRKHFEITCTQNCYQSRVSACCSREGIITFFGDVVINVLVSGETEIKGLATVLQRPNTGFKCIYLGGQGCMWRIKPMVCEMFLCEQAKKEVFGLKPWADKLFHENQSVVTLKL